jgi:hypothetical protein
MTTTRRTSDHDYSDVALWCHYLAKHPRQKGRGIDFGSIGDSLKTHGLICITHLTSGFFNWQDLMKCLGIEMGTTITILEYAKEDVQAIDKERLIFPDLS